MTVIARWSHTPRPTREKRSDLAAPLVVSDIKELKKSYAIDMDDTEQNAILIIAAFVTHFNIAKEGVRVKSMFKLSVEQMGAALAWMKNKDENFSHTGINFKINDKL